MKKNRISAILFLAVILSVIIYSAYGMVNQGKDDDYISVSVIVNDSSNTRWNAFREGLEQGAEDNQVHLNLVSTGSFQNVQEENTIVKRELEGGADGIIVEPYSGEADSVLQGVAADSVVLVKTGIETDTLYTSVMTDHINSEKSGRCGNRSRRDKGWDFQWKSESAWNETASEGSKGTSGRSRSGDFLGVF